MPPGHPGPPTNGRMGCSVISVRQRLRHYQRKCFNGPVLKVNRTSLMVCSLRCIPLAVCFRRAGVNLDFPWPTVILMQATRGRGGHHDEQDPVARRAPTGPMSWPVRPLAPDADTPKRPDSPRAVGTRRGVDRAGAARARGATGTAARGGPQTPDGDPAGGAPSPAAHHPGLRGRAAAARTAPGPLHAPG